MSSPTENNIDKIFKNESFLTVDLIMDYLDDKLTPEYKHKVEKALINDVFLTEAIEGLEAMSSEERKTVLYNLLGKEQKEARVIPYKLIGIAAATLLGISSIFLITRSLLTPTEETIAYKEVIEEKKESIEQIVKNKQASELTKNEVYESEPIEELDQAVEEIEEEVKETTTKEVEEVIKPLASPLQKKVSAFDSTHIQHSSKQIDKNTPELVNIETDKEELKVKEAELPKQSPRELALNMIQSLKKKSLSTSYNVNGSTLQPVIQGEISELTKKEASALDNYTQGVTAFNNGDYSESQKKLEAAYKKNNKVGDIKYFLAASYLCGSNNFEKAKKVFQLENPQALTQEKQWLRAIISLNEGKSDEAKIHLEKLALSNSAFKQEAITIIKALK